MRNRRYLFFFVAVLFFWGCRSKEKITTAVFVPRLSSREIIHRVENQNFEFKTVFYKRVAISFDDGKQDVSFKANIFLKRDSSMVLSIAPAMGIELYRILLLPGQVHILDRLNREVTLADYNSFYQRFLIELNFDLIQDVLTNHLFYYPLFASKGIHSYQGDVVHSDYVLSSLNQRKLERLSQHRNVQDVIFHQILINSDIFRVKRNIIKDFDQGLDVDIEYSDFKASGVSEGFFPQKIFVRGTKGSSNFKVSIKFGEVDFDGLSKISFKVPDKYETIRR